MNFHVLTLFPEMIEQGLQTSITGRAMKNNTISLQTVNIRDYSENKHNQVDDYPYGGGAGMVMAPGPVYRAYKAVEEGIFARDDNSKDKKLRVIYLTPQGRVFNQAIAEELSKEEDLVFLCGHYEGIDERVLEMIVTDYVSIGDYVLTGGELPAMVMIDAIARLVPGVLNNDASAEFETFHDNLLEYPQYTRPETFMDKSVPKVLLSGHHGNVAKWRRQQSLIRTANIRPDLLEKAKLTKEDIKFLEEYNKSKK
ncbi:MAG: tRNA (guanosine(37)-N1)-methyltransferase TrmD [Clostridiales bacterium]|nr:tRNA (guanosine(37)-N1)-methyltransferase TrmD [Clostridiales bacterium]